MKILLLSIWEVSGLTAGSEFGILREHLVISLGVSRKCLDMTSNKVTTTLFYAFPKQYSLIINGVCNM
jgi:hypothetical protein